MNPNLTQLLIERLGLPADWLADDVMDYLEERLVKGEWPGRDDPLGAALGNKEGVWMSFERAFMEGLHVHAKRDKMMTLSEAKEHGLEIYHTESL